MPIFYLGMVAILMFIAPIVSIIVDLIGTTNADFIAIAGKWFVFWAVGVRLATAGLRQTLTPAFTAQTIFRLTDPKSFTVVQELGFGNIAVGVGGIVSVFDPNWVFPMAVTGMLFYGFAGIRHIFNREQTMAEKIAMFSDLWAAAVLAIYVVVTLVR